MIHTLDFKPRFRQRVGFDHLPGLIDTALLSSNRGAAYPAYDIEQLQDDHYAITLEIPGFELDQIDIDVEDSVLTVRASKQQDKDRSYLYQGIASRAFERKFKLAEHVEASAARLHNGLLKIELVRRVPEAMKPRKIEIMQQDASSNETKAERPSTQAA